MTSPLPGRLSHDMTVNGVAWRPAHPRGLGDEPENTLRQPAAREVRPSAVPLGSNPVTWLTW